MDYSHLIDLINLFERHEGFWSIDKSEGDNLSVRWCPFVFDEKGRSFELFHKRVYCLKEFYNFCVGQINPYLVKKEDLL